MINELSKIGCKLFSGNFAISFFKSFMKILFSIAKNELSQHCVKIVQIRSFFWSAFCCIFSTHKFFSVKLTFFTPFLCKRTYVYQGLRNSFSGNIAYAPNGWFLLLHTSLIHISIKMIILLLFNYFSFIVCFVSNNISIFEVPGRSFRIQ